MLREIFAVFLTIISGIFVLVVGEIAKAYFFGAWQEYKQLKGEIAYRLSYYAREYTTIADINNCSESEQAHCKMVCEQLRDLGSRLIATSETRNKYVWYIPKSDELLNAGKALIGLSNATFPRNNDEMKRNIQRKEKIQKLLHLQEVGEDMP